MPRDNQVVINDNADHYICKPCDRDYNSRASLVQHARQASRHRLSWCERCQWLFVDSDARADHEANSSAHWICKLCKKDETNESQLFEHAEVAHNYCIDCSTYFRDHLSHRIEHHHRCRECEVEFESSNNLIMHQQTHLALDKGCYGCSRCFAANSAILIHLESGSCESGVDIDDIHSWAVECYQHRHYTNEDSQEFPYHCPTCKTNFATVSALFQHVESPACDAGYKGSLLKLQKFVKRNVAIFEDSDSADS